MSDETDSKFPKKQTFGKYQEEPFDQRLNDEQRSWNDGFSMVANKDSPEEGIPYTGVSPEVAPDPITVPDVKGTDAPPENSTRSAEDPPEKTARNTEAPELSQGDSAVSSGKDVVPAAQEPERSSSKFLEESNQLVSDAQRDWEEKQRGTKAEEDSAPNTFDDPGSAYDPLKGQEIHSTEDSSESVSIRSTSDAGSVGSSIDVEPDVGARSSNVGAGETFITGAAAYGNASTTGATVIIQSRTGNSPNIGKMALRTIKGGGRRVVSSAVPTNQLKQTHMGSGTSTVYNTAGRYIFIPGVKFAFNRVTGASTTVVSRVMLHQRKKSGLFETLYSDPDFQNAVSKALRQKMGRGYINLQQMDRIEKDLMRKGYGTDIKSLKNLLKKGSLSANDKTLVSSYISMNGKKKKLYKIVNPSGANNINSYYVVIKKSLRDRGLEPNAGKLKKSLKKGKLTGVDKQLAEAFVGINSIRKLSEYNRLSVASAKRAVKRGGTRIVRDFKRKLKQMMRNSQNYTAEGLIFTYTMARRSLKVAHSVIKNPAKVTGKVVIRSVRQATQMTRAGSMMARTTGKVATPMIKQTYKRQMKSAVRGGTRLTRRVVGSVDRVGAKLVSKGTAKAARMSSKTAAKAVKLSTKIAAKAMVAATKTVMFIVNLVISLLTTALAALLPVIVIVMVVGILIGGLLAIFSFNGGEMEDGTDSDTIVLVGQQYVDALDKCHEKFKEYLDQLCSDSSYETVTISYKDEKNTKVYKDWENETGMVDGDNNIKECLCLMAVLFDFNMEEYVPKPLTDEIKMEDREKLYDFLEINDIDVSEYDGTYQNLIRSYLVGLFNGSHDVQKSVSVTYCGGCTSRKNSEGEDEYYCPGHRHLDVTVTTYYFDKLFQCALKATCGADPLSSTLVGSSTVEKIWFGLINAGYSEQAAAGIIGNLMWESGGGPNDIALNAVEDNGQGVGMVQWSFDRKTAFIQYCSAQGKPWPNEDVTVQFNFMLSEMEGSDWLYGGYDYGASKSTNISLDAFKKLDDVDYATRVFCAMYERCSYSQSHIETRVEYAQNVYNSYHGRSQSAGGSGETLQPGQTTVSLGTFKLTYYCGCYECNEGYNDAQGRPIGSLGNPLTENHSIAVDPSVIPYGSKVVIDGIVYTAEDCGGAINGNHIDIYVGNDSTSHAKANNLGVNYAEVFLVK